MVQYSNIMQLFYVQQLADVHMTSQAPFTVNGTGK